MSDFVRIESSEKFVVVPQAIIREHLRKIGPTSFAVYVVLRQYADFKTGDCYPKIDTIAEMVGISRSTIKRTVSSLVESGLLIKQSGAKTGSVNRYWITPSHMIGGDSPAGGGWVKLNQGVGQIEPGGGSPMTHPNKEELEPSIKEQNLCPAIQQDESFALNGNLPEKELPKKERSKRNPRHTRFMELIFKAHEYYVKVAPVLGPLAGKNLARLLKDSGEKLTESRFVRMLKYYHLSEDHGPADAPGYYILKLPKYELGPLNKYGRAMEDQVKGVGSGYAVR